MNTTTRQSRPSGPAFRTAQFHFDTGPAALFDRVRFQLQGRRKLRFHAAHTRRHLAEGGAPVGVLQDFDAETWTLVAAGVRTDTGKFVNSTWLREVDDHSWWVVIGFGDTIETVTQTEPRGAGPDIVTAGPLYRRVQQVNEALLDADD
ncbi:hypothetical protein LAJ19_20015 (plasmid) [Deinococcus taeanensis]|uniref:hypothetical protein n=1 Tax=Deinococcus taeanensis TaxID=2737050 RepID=UPI001CDC0A43|nr:hypothetical protein [Deinococcus taeanensis]UBV45420.1 hypothetical protein LAJ19_20015 [Deinococcus taeanensis]